MTRETIDRLIDDGQAVAAAAALVPLFDAAPTAASAAYVVSRFERLAPSLALAPLRLALLRSFTIEPLVPLLRARCYLAGIDAAVMVADHNVFAQELLEPAGRVYAFAPDVIVVAALTRDLAPALWHGDGDLAAESAMVGAQLTGWIDACRRHCAASIIVQSFEQPPYPADGVLDVLAANGQRRAIDGLNARLREAAASHRGVYVLDYDALVSRYGRLAWSDAHKDLAMRVPLRPDAFAALADEYMRVLRPLRGRTCKAVAVDLDNTLWGGVLGEDGSAGIQIGVEYPGSAYLALQRELKALTRRGILLAVCSKNDPEEALAVLRDHPEMLLRPSDFSAMRISWDDKAASLRAIAGELNIGIDALAFLDDNPAERDWVRSQLPGVYVIDLPGDPVGYVDALRRAPVFERLELSSEDRSRAAQYRAQRARAESAASAQSVEDFLRSLEMRAMVDDLTPATLGRAAQLTQKTNQFNVTTQRYSEETLVRFAAEPGAMVRTVRVTDRYGDNGLVGLVMARVRDTRCDIDTMLLSCRVIGRQIETLLLADVAAQARGRGARTLRGCFRPTAKNAPAATVYRDHGFSLMRDGVDGSLWELDLTQQAVTAPDFITRGAER